MQETASTIFQYLWIGYLVAAFMLFKKGAGNKVLLAGLVGLGAIGLIRFIFQEQIYSARSDLAVGLSVLSAGSLLAVIVGVILLALRPAMAGATPVHFGGEVVNLGSLFTPRNDTNTISQAVTLRDAALEKLVALAKEDRLQYVEQKSSPHSAAVWLCLDYSIPSSDPHVSLRAYVQVTVERFDYHRFEHLFSVHVQVGTRKKTIPGVIAFENTTAKAIHRFVTVSGSNLSLPGRIRINPWELWRPANKPQRIRQDWLSSTISVAGGVLLFLVPVGTILGIVLLIGLYIRNSQRRTFVLTTGKPRYDPRSLRWLDSWQASIAGLGDLAAAVRVDLMTRITSRAPVGLSIGIESFDYASVDGRVKQDQMAVSYRRALGFIHVEPYGEALYVAWECHLNSATWVEATLAHGVDRVTGNDVNANRVVAGSLALNEYDVADANFLAEWLHEAVKQVVKLRMTDRQIDQEIDFTVQRESRKNALIDHPTATPAAQAPVKPRLQRVG